MARNRFDVDETLEEKFDLGQLKRLGKYILPYKKEMGVVIFLMLSTSLLSMLIPRFLMTAMDEYIPQNNIKGLVFISLAALMIAIYAAFSLRQKIKITSTIGQSIIHSLRSDIFNHLQELPFSYYDDRPNGKIQVRVVNYINNLSDLLSNGIINTITDLCSLFFIMIFMLTINVKLSLVCLCGLPVLSLIVIMVKKRQHRAWQIQSNKQSNLNAYIAESIDGIRVTQSFVREEENSGIFNQLSNSYRQSWMTAVRYNFILGPTVDLISSVTTAFIYVIGVSYISNSLTGITVGVLIAFTSYIGRFWAPITTLAGFYNSMLTAISYMERIFETIDEPVLVKDCEGAFELPEIHGDVTFEEVSFRYDEESLILDRINFTANQGQSFAIVGPTGAGKSTIVNLLSRFYNLESGRILIDGIDISKVTIPSLRSQMGIMMQDSFIFSGTIIENIRYGRLDATDEEVIQAATTVCAHEFIMQLEQGYYTEVNERGSRLSVGQRQLISFARALLADPKILILDEATSSIDTETEIALQKGLNRLLKGRTSFIIAHRLSTIKNSSCILYLDKGKIKEMGTHNQLMGKCGEYHRLFMSQYDFLSA